MALSALLHRENASLTACRVLSAVYAMSVISSLSRLASFPVAWAEFFRHFRLIFCAGFPLQVESETLELSRA